MEGVVDSTSNSRRVNTNNGPGIDISTVTTGVMLEEKSFIWKIENFDVVRKSKEMIQKQRFDFHAGDSLGLPSDWSSRLWYHVKPSPVPANELLIPIDAANSSSTNTEWIGVFYHLEKFPEGVQELTFLFSYVIYNKSGEVFYSLEVPAKCMKDVGDLGGWGKKCVIMKRANVADLPLIDGALIIYSKFRLYAPKPARSDIVAKTARFQTLSVQKLGMDLAASISSNYSDSGSGAICSPSAKMISREGQEFLVDRGFLSARSKVFQAMFLSQMQETHTGLIYLDDLSSQTISVLLHFIYTGTLQDKWSHPDIIVEFTYAADKYEFIELLQFLDQVLGSVCTKQTAGKLLVLASRISLKNAEKEIFTFIQRQTTSTQQLIAFAKDIASAETNVLMMNFPNCKSETLIDFDNYASDSE